MYRSIILSAFLALALFAFTAVAQQSEAAASSKKVATFTVKGMTCMGCVSKVKKAALSVDGVLDCDVSLKDGVAKVSYDPEKVNEKQILAALQKTDYTVSLGTGDKTTTDNAETSTKSKKKHECNTADCCKSK